MFRARALAGVSLSRRSSSSRSVHVVADHDLLDVLDDAPPRARDLGAGGSRRRRGRARGGPGKTREARAGRSSSRASALLRLRESRSSSTSSTPGCTRASAFLHHAIGWMLVVVALFPLGHALDPRRVVWRAGFALTFVLLAVLLFADRDAAPIFGRFGLGRAVMRWLALVVVVAACALAVPLSRRSRTSPCWARTPSRSRSFDTPPTAVRSSLQPAGNISANAIEVLAPDGTVLSGAARTEDDGYVVVAPVSGLARGHGYTVRWRVIGDDGHKPGRRVHVRSRDRGAPADRCRRRIGHDVARRSRARWALFAALALLIGAARRQARDP